MIANQFQLDPYEVVSSANELWKILIKWKLDLDILYHHTDYTTAIVLVLTMDRTPCLCMDNSELIAVMTEDSYQISK